MKTNLLIAVAVACASFAYIPASAAETQSGSEPLIGANLLQATETSISTNGLVGKIYAPPNPSGRYPAILVLGGSEGGVHGSAPIASALAQHGYVTFALAYFGENGLPKELTNIPLEYFRTALNYLQTQPNVDPKRIGLAGSSKGAEAALLIASRNPMIKVVVVGAPSSVAWPGINRQDYADPSGSWTEGGKPIPFLPYDSSTPFTTIYNLYDGGLKNIGEHQDAVIPVERIHGALMLICGEADSLSPSCKMADSIVERLRTKRFSHRISTLHYPNVGHIVFNLPLTPDQAADPAVVARLNSLGGNSTDNLKALVNSWDKAITFFDQELRR